jgi:hypothetical protein
MKCLPEQQVFAFVEEFERIVEEFERIVVELVADLLLQLLILWTRFDYCLSPGREFYRLHSLARLL